MKKRGVNMGIYLNPGNDLFKMSVNSQIYVDKTMLVAETNRMMFGTSRHICISRPPGSENPWRQIC